MNTLSYKTVSANKATAKKEWVVVDAAGQPLGRLASKVAKILRGKHKTNYTPHVDCGDNVIVLNAEQSCFIWQQVGRQRIHLAYWISRWSKIVNC